jgi:phosphoribosyl-ATP pyrophosphohydrolase/phosphoribosyl-AMP cyclohydrolase
MIDFNKTNGLVPVIIQDDRTLQVLMLGYMNEKAFEKTRTEGIVTFFSRSKNRLWTKGEESGNFLTVKNIAIDCDQDTILIKAIPKKIVCHTGIFSCFGDKETKGFLYELEEKIGQRIDEKIENSYTYSLYQKGINKVAQKVGEEAVELVIEAKDNNKDLFKNEAADLLYHFLILLKAKNFTLQEIEEILMSRNQ